MAQNTAQNARSRTAPARDIHTLEHAIALSPTHTSAHAITQAFGLTTVEYADIRDSTEKMLIEHAETLRPNLNDQAMEIHLQRIVGSYVASACGAGVFYSNKVSAARELTSRLSNDARDEDRDGVAGFDSRAERARHFAAQMGLQAYALTAAAEGAVAAFAHATGSEWKPYRPSNDAAPVSRRAAEAQMAAFEAA